MNNISHYWTGHRYIYIYVYIYTHTYIYTYIYTHIYIQIYTHMYHSSTNYVEYTQATHTESFQL